MCDSHHKYYKYKSTGKSTCYTVHVVGTNVAQYIICFVFLLLFLSLLNYGCRGIVEQLQKNV